MPMLKKLKLINDKVFKGLWYYLNGQLQGQQERGERGKWALPAFAACLIRQTNGRYDRSNRL